MPNRHAASSATQVTPYKHHCSMFNTSLKSLVFSAATAAASMLGLFMTGTSPYPLFVVAGKDVQAVSAILTSSTPSYWLDVLSIDSLDNVHIQVSQSTLEELSSALVVAKKEEFVAGGPFGIELYSSATAVGSGEVPGVKAIGTLECVDENTLRYRFFRYEQAHYVEDATVTISLKGPFVRQYSLLMHLAATSSGQTLDVETSRYMLSSTSDSGLASGFWQRPLDHTLVLEALANTEFSAGARAIGFFTDELYNAILGYTPSATAKHCGNNSDCPVSVRQHCTGYPQYDCFGPDDDGCSTSMIQVASSNTIIPNYALLWVFRDTFLEEYPRGVEYRNYYYIFSHFAKMDGASLLLYADFLPHAYSAVNKLLEGNSTDIIVTEALFDAAMAIIDHHSNVSSVLVQSILAIAAEDLNAYYGMTRAQFITAFTQ